MSKLQKRIFALVCAAILLLCGVTAALADFERKEDAPQILVCTEIPLFVDSSYLGSGFVIDSVPYVPLLAFTECILESPCEAEWDQATSTVNLRTGVVEMALTTDKTYMVVNGRYLPLETGVYNINGTIMVPLRVLATIFNLHLSLDEEAWCIRIDMGNMCLLESGEEFYPAEDLYWLSRVISAEAGNQPLNGMIGVGNVVINRVNDDSGLFSDSIKGVIFQTGQFDVVSAGTIYEEPRSMAVVAAKLCLEGCNTVGESKWFVNPTCGHTAWFYAHKTFEVSIADHLFYT